MFHHFPRICLWPLGNGNYLKQNTGRTIFLCLPSLLSQSTIWKFVTARLLLFEIAQSEPSLIALYIEGYIWKHLDYTSIEFLLKATSNSALNSPYIVPLPYDPHETQRSSVFNSLSYHLWALFKVLHIGPEIRNREERSVGERAFPWFTCQTQHWSSDLSHTRSLLLVDGHLSPLPPKPRFPPLPYSYTFKAGCSWIKCKRK